jgi:hypothetical protein
VTSLDTLTTAGFERFGEWQHGAEHGPHGVGWGFPCPAIPGVYAFVVDGAVMYVGSAQRGLRTRLRQYTGSTTLKTAARIRAEIIAALSAGCTVEVYSLTPPQIEWHGLPVDLVAGIEEGLIRKLRPAWNQRSNRAS